MNHDIVASAITSFNNAALVTPNFLWLAVLAAPIFLAAMKLAPEIMMYFFPTKKSRNDNFAWMVEVLLIVWIIFDFGNWRALRDGAGWLPYLNAACLFLLCRDASARLYIYNPRIPKWWRKMGRAFRQWGKIGALFAAMGILAASTVQIFNFVALQICSVMFGIASGYFRRRPAQPVNYMTVIMLAVTIGITLQPEYFRFGQLGRLTIAHLVALASLASIAPMIFIFRNCTPTGFIKNNHYKYIKWFMRLGCLLAFILFVMTESVPVLLGCAAAVMGLSWFAVKHADRGSNVFNLSNNLWALMFGMFGALTVMPAVTVIGILCWKNNNIKNFWKSLWSVLK